MPVRANRAISPFVKLEKLKALLAEYGRVAIWTYFVIFALVLAGFAIAIAYGFDVKSAQGGAGTLGAAYLATKATQPLRIAGTLALTPLVARIVRRFERKVEQPGEASSSAPGGAP
jgi:hypothetical protein